MWFGYLWFLWLKAEVNETRLSFKLKWPAVSNKADRSSSSLGGGGESCTSSVLDSNMERKEKTCFLFFTCWLLQVALKPFNPSKHKQIHKSQPQEVKLEHLVNRPSMCLCSKLVPTFDFLHNYLIIHLEWRRVSFSDRAAMARIASIWVLQSHKQLGEDVVVMDVYEVENPNEEDWIPEGRLRTI